jgi:hypothetical protein
MKGVVKMLTINNQWFMYNKKDDRFEIRGDLLHSVPITPGAMKELADCAKEILEARGEHK